MSQIPRFIRSVVNDLNLPSVTILPQNPFSTSFYQAEFEDEGPTIHVRGCAIGQRKLALHEIGHHFFETYIGTIIPRATVRRLFGNMSEEMPSGLFAGISRFLPGDIEGYITMYAQTHPEEDFAEIFAEVMNEGEPLDYEDDIINEKIEFVWECIQKARG